MNRKLKVLLIFSGALIILYFIGSLTKIFTSARMSNTVNKPTFKTKEIFYFSVLKKPARFDFICFYGPIPYEEGIYMRAYRLCGLEGDVVEMRKGILFVNNEAADGQFTLSHNYLLSLKQLNDLRDKDSIENEDILGNYLSPDSTIVAISDAFAKRNSLSSQIQFLDKDFDEPVIDSIYHEKWNRDNFGSITVPKDKYFVLGDNRHNASDSRLEGFIDKKNFAGTVLWKK